MLQFYCEICHTRLGLDSKTMICDQLSCQKASLIRKDLQERIEMFEEHFKGRIPDEYTYREYLEKTGLEEKYKQFAGIIDEDSIPKCSRRIWFQLNFILGHQSWPDEYGRIKNAA